MNISARTSHHSNTLAPPAVRTKKCTSISTNESPASSKDNFKCDNKEKSQLCKRYMENGYCPYDKRCKFAHGLHELKKNDHFNAKYKTKQCGSFKINEFCIYGDRCNFIHSRKPIQQALNQMMGDHTDIELNLVKRCARDSSRLMALLQ